MSDDLRSVLRTHHAYEGGGGATECTCAQWGEWLAAHPEADTEDGYADHLHDVIAKLWGEERNRADE